VIVFIPKSLMSLEIAVEKVGLVFACPDFVGLGEVGADVVGVEVVGVDDVGLEVVGVDIVGLDVIKLEELVGVFRINVAGLSCLSDERRRLGVSKSKEVPQLICPMISTNIRLTGFIMLCLKNLNLESFVSRTSNGISSSSL